MHSFEKSILRSWEWQPDAKNQYSLEGYHPPRPKAGEPDKTEEYRDITKQCVYVLEFIFSVFN